MTHLHQLPDCCPVEEIQTPFLLVDAEIAHRNIQWMADYARHHDLDLRPHTKTHKSLHVARKQLDAGAIGLTVAKVGEAEVMRHVCEDLLIAYPIVDAARAKRIAQLAFDADMKVAIDSAGSAEVLGTCATATGSQLGILIDVDVGYGRTGVQGIDGALGLAKCVEQTPGLALRGIFLYPGHVLGNAQNQTQQFSQLSNFVAELVDRFQRNGHSTEIISSGTTPTAMHSHLLPEVTEIRPGTYLFNDMNIVSGGYRELTDCAATIVTTVVSDAVPDQVILDAGSKALTSDLRNGVADSGHGYIVEYPEAKIFRLTEEHGQVDMSASPVRPRIGERLTVVPNHICVCVNLQDHIWWRENSGSNMASPLSVDARGRLT